MKTLVKTWATRLITTGAAMMALTAPAHAADFIFNTDPFAGSTALTTPGRQVVANEQTIANFNLATDRLVFDAKTFGVPANLSFATGLGRDLPAAGANVISLQDIDADGNPGNGILNNAGLSADLIAAAVTNPGAGFFLYFNTALDLDRLVFSTDLSDPTADLKVLARFTNLSGQDGATALQQFSSANFATAGAVPEPATWAMMIVGVGAVGSMMRRRAKVAGGLATANR